MVALFTLKLVISIALAVAVGVWAFAYTDGIWLTIIVYLAVIDHIGGALSTWVDDLKEHVR